MQRMDSFRFDEGPSFTQHYPLGKRIKFLTYIPCACEEITYNSSRRSSYDCSYSTVTN